MFLQRVRISQMEAATSSLSVQHIRSAIIVPLPFHCHGIEDQPPHLSHRPCSAWEGLCRQHLQRGQSHLPAVQSALRRGGHPTGERWSRCCVGRHPCPNLPTDCSPGDGRPSAVNPACQLSLRTHRKASRGKKTLSRFCIHACIHVYCRVQNYRLV